MINNLQTICTLSLPICAHTACCFIAIAPQAVSPRRRRKPPHRHEELQAAELTKGCSTDNGVRFSRHSSRSGSISWAAFRTSLPLIIERRDDIEPELGVAHERVFIGGVAILQGFVPVVEAAKADNRSVLET